MALYETREQWGSTETDLPGYKIGKVHEVIAHHSWKPHINPDVTVDVERSVTRGIQKYHVGNGWDDIGYQWLVYQSGRAYEGRGWFRTGAHTVGRNSKSVGVCFVIDGDRYEPTEAAWETARNIIAEGVKVGALGEGYKVSGHTDYAAKSCPGTRTYPKISRLRRDVKERTVTAKRIGGGTRHETAMLLARTKWQDQTGGLAFLVNPASFDAAAIANVASMGRILTVDRDKLPEATRVELGRFKPDEVVAVGGENAVSTEVLEAARKAAV